MENRSNIFSALISGYENALEVASKQGDIEMVRSIYDLIVHFITEYDLTDMTVNITKSLAAAKRAKHKQVYEELEDVLDGVLFRVDKPTT